MFGPSGLRRGRCGRIRRVGAVAVAVCGMVLPTACAADTAPQGSPTTPTSPTDAVSTLAALPPAQPTLPPARTSTTPTASHSPVSTRDFCDSLLAYGEVALERAETADLTPDVVSTIDQLAADAPADIAPDLQLLDEEASVSAIPASMDVPLPYSHAEVVAAQDHVEAWMTTHCGY